MRGETRVLDPQTAYDFVIKTNNIKELVYTFEVSEDFIAELNRKVINLVLVAASRCQANNRRRLREFDL